MNNVLRDLGTRVASAPVPSADVTALLGAGEARLRRRRLVVAGAAVGVVAALVGAAAWLLPGNRDAAGPPAGHDHRNPAPHVVRTVVGARPLTYAVGTTIHWGDRMIDVGSVARGRLVRENGLDDIEVTDDGVVFVTGPEPKRFTVPVAESAVWFTDGGDPVRIGSTLGNAYRGFPVVGAAEGSVLTWREPLDGSIVVYDTRSMGELARLGDEQVVLLAVLADAVYWTPSRAPCLIEADFGCLRWRTVRRFDTMTRRESPVSWDAFVAERRSRPGVLAGRYDGDAPVPGLVDYGDLSFERRGDRLVSDSRAVDVRPRVPGSDRPLRLRVPAGGSATRYTLVQWLDADQVVLISYRGDGGSELNDAGDLLVCHLSTGSCRVEVHGGRRPFAVPLAD